MPVLDKAVQHINERYQLNELESCPRYLINVEPRKLRFDDGADVSLDRTVPLLQEQRCARKYVTRRHARVCRCLLASCGGNPYRQNLGALKAVLGRMCHKPRGL